MALCQSLLLGGHTILKELPGPRAHGVGQVEGARPPKEEAGAEVVPQWQFGGYMAQGISVRHRKG
eukprot:1134676-Pelagomonas_calceolata.AAC.1